MKNRKTIVTIKNINANKGLLKYIPLNKERLSYDSSIHLADYIISRLGNQCDMRIQDGSIQGYEYIGRYTDYTERLSLQAFLGLVPEEGVWVNPKTSTQIKILQALTGYDESLFVDDAYHIQNNRIDGCLNKKYANTDFAFIIDELLKQRLCITFSNKKQLDWFETNIPQANDRIAVELKHSRELFPIREIGVMMQDKQANMASNKTYFANTTTDIINITCTDFKAAWEMAQHKQIAWQLVTCTNLFEVRHLIKTYNSDSDWLTVAFNYSEPTFSIVNRKIVGCGEPSWYSEQAVMFDALYPSAKATPEFKRCDYSGNVIEGDPFVASENRLIDADLVTNGIFTRCTICNLYEETNNISTIDGRLICYDCVKTETFTCDHCGQRHLNIHKHTGNNMTLCDDCRELYVVCGDCENFIFAEESRMYNGYMLCENCYEERVVSDTIHDYYYKPEPIFYRTDYADDNKRYFGVELEIDGDGESNRNAYDITEKANADAQHVYCKHDGSLSDGFEIVSHPATLAYHMNEFPWQDIMSKAISMGYRSHNTTTCGLHVHVNRNSLGSTEEKQDETIAKILLFIELHWNEIVRFTRRSEYNLERWANRYGWESTGKKILDKAKYNGDRYHAVNLCNSNTIEFRIFRGTLKYNTFIATLQFVNLVCDFCKYHSEGEINNTSWNDIVLTVSGQELIQYLKERRLYVNETVETEEDM